MSSCTVLSIPYSDVHFLNKFSFAFPLLCVQSCWLSHWATVHGGKNAHGPVYNSLVTCYLPKPVPGHAAEKRSIAIESLSFQSCELHIPGRRNHKYIYIIIYKYTNMLHAACRILYMQVPKNRTMPQIMLAKPTKQHTKQCNTGT